MSVLRERVRRIIFESDTPAGRAFDVVLMVCILASVLAVLADSLPYVHDDYGRALYVVEWFFTILFTIEYVLRLWSIDQRLSYAKSFYGITDLLGTIPTYLSLLFPGAQFMLVIRILRVLRVFRVLRLFRFVREANVLVDAIRASRAKITVFLVTVMSLTVVFGSLMYLIEGPEHGFTSIPASMYWAVVTVTTVGYGDIAPGTPLGRIIAAILMISGYGILAVPTGIFSAELITASRRRTSSRVCTACAAEGHSEGAAYCYRCGHHLQQKIVLPEEGAPQG
jgi:voltage-gated potassium channel